MVPYTCMIHVDKKITCLGAWGNMNFSQDKHIVSPNVRRASKKIYYKVIFPWMPSASESVHHVFMREINPDIHTQKLRLLMLMHSTYMIQCTFVCAGVKKSLVMEPETSWISGRTSIYFHPMSGGQVKNSVQVYFSLRRTSYLVTGQVKLLMNLPGGQVSI